MGVPSRHFSLSTPMGSQSPLMRPHTQPPDVDDVYSKQTVVTAATLSTRPRGLPLT